jgi:hypothetical protein
VNVAGFILNFSDKSKPGVTWGRRAKGLELKLFSDSLAAEEKVLTA